MMMERRAATGRQSPKSNHGTTVVWIEGWSAVVCGGVEFRRTVGTKGDERAARSAAVPLVTCQSSGLSRLASESGDGFLPRCLTWWSERIQTLSFVRHIGLRWCSGTTELSPVATVQLRAGASRPCIFLRGEKLEERVQRQLRLWSLEWMCR